MTSQVAQGGLGTFPHRLAQKSRQCQRPLPGIPLASMNRISPPLGVHARPVETPGTPVRSASSRKKRDGPRRSEMALGSTTVESFATLGASAGDFAADGCDLPLKVAQAGLPRVIGDDLADRRVRDRQVRAEQGRGDRVALG